MYTITTTTTQILDVVYNPDSLSLGGMLIGTKHCRVISAASLATPFPLDRAALCAFAILIVCFTPF
jgi:hypothetical protein